MFDTKEYNREYKRRQREDVEFRMIERARHADRRRERYAKDKAYREECKKAAKEWRDSHKKGGSQCKA